MTQEAMTAYIFDTFKKKGYHDVELSFTRGTKHELNIQQHEISLLRTIVNESLSINVIDNHKKGTINSNQLDKEALDEAIDKVIRSVEVSEPDPAHSIAEKEPHGEFSSGPEEGDYELMFTRADDFLKRAGELYPDLHFDTSSLTFTSIDRLFCNTNDVRFTSRKGFYSFFVMFTTKRGTRSTSFNYTGFDAKELPRPLHEKAMIDFYCSQSEKELEAKKLEGGFKGTLILSPSCVGDFINYFTGMFLKDHPIITGTSLLKDSIGKMVAAPGFTLSAKGAAPFSATPSFFTRDGHRTEPFDIIKNGELQSFMLSRYGARKTGLERAKNYGSGYVIEPGNTSIKEMIGDTKRGVILHRFSGGRPAHDGEISGLCKNSFYVENGEVRYPLQELMMSSNLLHIFKAISAISSERVNFGDELLPWLKIEDIVFNA